MRSRTVLAVMTACPLALMGCGQLQDHLIRAGTNLVVNQAVNSIGNSGSKSQTQSVQQQTRSRGTQHSTQQWVTWGRDAGANAANAWMSAGVVGMPAIITGQWNSMMVGAEYPSAVDLKRAKRRWVLRVSMHSVVSDARAVQMVGETNRVAFTDYYSRPQSLAPTIADIQAYSTNYASSLLSALEGWRGRSGAEALRDLSKARADTLLDLYLRTYGDDGIRAEVNAILNQQPAVTNSERTRAPQNQSQPAQSSRPTLIGYTLGDPKMPVFRNADGTVYSFDQNGEKIDASTIPWVPEQD